MSDSKYFQSTKKGEVQEWRNELTGNNSRARKEAVKKVIAAMTVGKDVSSIFAEVLNCMQTTDLELKKLVYLYLVNYAKAQPDLAILAVNTFVNDSQDNDNPLIRALAIRTMGCIRVDKITEYLCDPLRKTLHDRDPYVRKTAAVCVAKLHDLNAELCEDRGFIDELRDLLKDGNPMVVANAIAALAEISDNLGRDLLKLDSSILATLMVALDDCTEWGQIFILDAVVGYAPADAPEAEMMVLRIIPRLQHANSGVVLSAAKVLLNLIDHVNAASVRDTILKKLGPPLVTLLSAEHEVQYVALRNITLIIHKYPEILSGDIRVFFVKYNDPPYIRMEKLDILVQLANESNHEQVLRELQEYAMEVDVDFVRKTVRAIGSVAVKLEEAAGKCVKVLLELIETKVSYVVQEAVVVIKDIFRRYPNRYESVISTLCENLDTLDEPDAKAALIWIIGEYSARIDNADELLGWFLESFKDESAHVQLQLLTSVVKLFLNCASPKTQEMAANVLNMASNETDNPDLRDRGFIYWRLLRADFNAAKQVVLAEKPEISADVHKLDPSLLRGLMKHISSLASVYHKLPESFVQKADLGSGREEDEDLGGLEKEEQPKEVSSEEGTPTPGPEPEAPKQTTNDIDDLLGLDLIDSAPAPAAPAAPAPAGDDIMDLGLGDMGAAAPAAPAPAKAADDFLESDDLFGLGGAEAAPAVPEIPYRLLLTADKGKGLEVRGTFMRAGDGLEFKLKLKNQSAAPLSGFAIRFNKNSLGLVPAARLEVPGDSIAPQQDVAVSLPCAMTGPMAPLAGEGMYMSLQVAVKLSAGVIYFQDSVLLAQVTMGPESKVAPPAFLQSWGALSGDNEKLAVVPGPLKVSSLETTTSALEAKYVFLVAKKMVEAQPVMYFACTAKRHESVPLLVELAFKPDFSAMRIRARCSEARLLPSFFELLKATLA